MTFWARILRGEMTWTCGAEHEEEESEQFDKKDEENEDECSKSKVKRKYEIDNDDCVDVTDKNMKQKSMNLMSGTVRNWKKEGI